MNQLGLLFVAEAALMHIDNGRRVGRTRVASIREELASTYPTLFADCSDREVRTALRLLFPIHKNGRSRQKVFKIRPKEAYELLDSKRMKLRPFADIQAKRNTADKLGGC